MPFIDLWSPEMGVALAHLEKQPEWLSLPVTVRNDGKVEAAILERPDPELGQKQLLKPGESYRTVLNTVIFHHLDFFDALKTYGNLLRSRGVPIPSSSPLSTRSASNPCRASPRAAVIPDKPPPMKRPLRRL